MFSPTAPEIVSDVDTLIARKSSDALAPLVDEKGASHASIRFCTESSREAEVSLPMPAVHLLLRALKEMAEGHAVTLLPVDAELTTQQSAELLRMSRPSLIKLLDEKKLPYRKVGAHRRIRYEDVLIYLKTERARRTKVMEELIAETERLGLY
jgi:excisionase family DNA binding protein